MKLFFLSALLMVSGGLSAEAASEICEGLSEEIEVCTIRSADQICNMSAKEFCQVRVNGCEKQSDEVPECKALTADCLYSARVLCMEAVKEDIKRGSVFGDW